MMSCEERNGTREQTLAGLAATDWGTEPVRVRIDDAKLGSHQERLTETALLALTDALGTDADFILFLEDDLEFNRHLRHNLLAWQPLREREITLAGLYNPNLRPKAVDVRLQRFVPDPNSVFGSQAFLLSRATVEYLVHHWSEVEGMPDIKMSRLAARLNMPLFYHYPSLVQHVGHQSVWGGRFHQAIDFDVDWRAPG